MCQGRVTDHVLAKGEGVPWGRGLYQETHPDTAEICPSIVAVCHGSDRNHGECQSLWGLIGKTLPGRQKVCRFVEG